MRRSRYVLPVLRTLGALGLALSPAIASASLDSELIVDPAEPSAGQSVTLRASGWLPDSCWSEEFTFECAREGNDITFTFYTTDHWRPGVLCLTVVFPFSGWCDLGALPAGLYSVEVREVQDSARSVLPVVKNHEFVVQPAVPTNTLRWSTLKEVFRRERQ